MEKKRTIGWSRLTLPELGARFPLLVLLLGLVITLVSVLIASRLKIENNLASLLPQQLESVQNLEKLKEGFGGLGHLMIVVESDDPERAGRFADILYDRLRNRPEIYYVDYRRPVAFFEEKGWLYIDLKDLDEVERRIDHALELEQHGVSPVFNDLVDFGDPEDRIDLTFDDILEKYQKRFGFNPANMAASVSSSDGQIRVLKVKPKSNPQSLDATKHLVGDLRGLVEQTKLEAGFQDVSVGFTGSYQKMVEQAALTGREIAMVSTLVSLLLFLILIVYFRKISSAIYVTIPLMVGVAWTGGLVTLWLGHLNIITSFAAAILAGLGSDYAIYLLARYERERARGLSFEEARILTFSSTGKATYLSMVATVAGFAALLLSKFSLFFEFGVVGCLGLVMSYIAIVLFLPALLALEEQWRQRRGSLLPPLGDRLWDCAKGLFRPRRPVLTMIFFATLFGVSVIALPRVAPIHFNDGQLENKSLTSYQLSDKIAPLFSLFTTPTVVILDGEEKEKETTDKIATFVEQSDPDKIVINHVLSESLFVPNHQQKKKEKLLTISKKAMGLQRSLGPKKDDFLKSLQDAIDSEPVTRANLPNSIRYLFESPVEPDLFAAYLNPSFGRISAESMHRYQDGIESLKQKTGLKLVAADNTFISSDLIKMITKEAPRGFALFLIFLGGILLLQVRPWKRAMAIYLHLLASLVLLGGLMWVFGLELNIINIAIIPVILGTAVDSFVHLGETIEANGADSPEVIDEIPAILISNLTSLVGFGGLVLTSSSGLRSAGWIASLGILVVTVVCVAVYPRYQLLAKRIRRYRDQKTTTIDTEPLEA